MGKMGNMSCASEFFLSSLRKDAVDSSAKGGDPEKRYGGISHREVEKEGKNNPLRRGGSGRRATESLQSD